MSLDESAFASGSLYVTSYARPGKLFTASRDLITARVGALKPDASDQECPFISTIDNMRYDV